MPCSGHIWHRLQEIAVIDPECVQEGSVKASSEIDNLGKRALKLKPRVHALFRKQLTTSVSFTMFGTTRNPVFLNSSICANIVGCDFLRERREVSGRSTYLRGRQEPLPELLVRWRCLAQRESYQEQHRTQFPLKRHDHLNVPSMG